MVVGGVRSTSARQRRIKAVRHGRTGSGAAARLLDRFKHVSASREHTEDRWAARGMGATFRLEAQVPTRCRGAGVKGSKRVEQSATDVLGR